MLDDQNQQMKNKISEDAGTINKLSKENEAMRGDIMKFHQIIELGMKENEQFKQEINRLRQELQDAQAESYGINNQNANILADKDKEIGDLRAELLRTKAMLSSQDNKNIPESYSQNQSSMLDMLINSNAGKELNQNFNRKGSSNELSYPSQQNSGVNIGHNTQNYL